VWTRWADSQCAVNLVLLCHHHTTTHLPGYTINRDATRLVINLPDGRTLFSTPPRSDATTRNRTPANADTLFGEEVS
jgi:hypothetical protein